MTVKTPVEKKSTVKVTVSKHDNKEKKQVKKEKLAPRVGPGFREGTDRAKGWAIAAKGAKLEAIAKATSPGVARMLAAGETASGSIKWRVKKIREGVIRVFTK